MNLLASEWGTGQVLWDMLWFFMFVIWFWLLITVFSDIFRSDDLGGFSKVMWCIFVIVLPYLGVFVYLIARGSKMQEHAMRAAQAQNDAAKQYIQSVATTSNPSEEIARLADLRDKGVISDTEFQAAKTKALA